MILPVIAVAFGVSVVATPLIRAIGRHAGVMDLPNERSSHQVPTPRGGGIAILLAIAVAALVAGLFRERVWFLALIATAIVALIGFIDDVKSAGAGVRFVTHTVAAALAVLFAPLILETIELPWGGTIALAALSVPITLFFVVGLTNAYNFMDGINGIASLEALVAAGTLGVLFLQKGDVAAAALAGALAAGAAGFLPWNFPSGSIFMGDVGSGAIGFLLALLVVRYSANGAFVPAILPLLPFLLDTAVTLVRRALRGERWYAAHRSHFYQRLNALGWSHTRVSLLWTGLAATGGLVSLWYAQLSSAGRVLTVTALVVAHVVLGLSITRRERSSNQAVSADGASSSVN